MSRRYRSIDMTDTARSLFVCFVVVKPATPSPQNSVVRYAIEALQFNFDALVKSPDTALRFILSHCSVQTSTLHSFGFARLVCGLFSSASPKRAFLDFLRRHQS
jgi:hypothetical protein